MLDKLSIRCIKRYKQSSYVYIAFGLLAVCFVFLQSFSTSPLYPFYWGSDSAQFQTIGKVWEVGKIPYSEIFDHKGPFIFWVNMLGYAIMGRSGVFVLQILFIFSTLVGVYKTLLLVSGKKYIKFLELSFFVCILMSVYSGGNMCEEYCLPFLMFSTYGQFMYLTEFDKKPKHSVFWGFFYGITVSVCLMTRATNAVAVLCGILIISILLLSKSEYKNFVINAVAFLCGVTIVFAPFAIYFQVHGAFDDFLFGTLGYNIIYISDKNSGAENSINLEYCIAYVRLFFSAIVCFPTFALALHNKRKYVAWYFLLVGLAENYLFFNGELYRHYAIIAVPNIVVFLIELEKSLQNNSVKYWGKKIISFALIMYIGISIIYGAKDIYIKFSRYNSFSPQYENLMSIIPKEDYEKVVAYGGGSLKDFYLRYNILPCYKYFVLQDSHGKRSTYVSQDIYSEFEKCDAKWILTDTNTTIISNILHSNYYKCGEEGNYALYRLAD